MAKRKPKFDFNQFLANLPERPAIRQIAEQPEREYILIVCEGEKTEPNYFKSIVDLLPPNLVSVRIEGKGYNTIDVVKYAIELGEKQKKDRLNPDFDEIWAVFDKDDFPNQRYNEAIALAKRNDVKVAYSNEAFELWYVLHFQFLHTGIGRKQYIKILKDKLGSYEKNAKSIYQLLQEKGDEERAIKWAKKLLKEIKQDNPALELPTTKVHILVEKLNRFKTQ